MAQFRVHFLVEVLNGDGDLSIVDRFSETESWEAAELISDDACIQEPGVANAWPEINCVTHGWQSAPFGYCSACEDEAVNREVEDLMEEEALAYLYF